MVKKKPSLIIQNKLLSHEEEVLKYREGLYLKNRKREYLFWFKFLQEAEKSTTRKVQWKHYTGWGGSNVILGTKFDDWWESNWKKLFGIKNKNGKPKFSLNKKRKPYETIRLSYLAHQLREIEIEKLIKPHVRFHGKLPKGKTSVTYKRPQTNHLTIADKIYQKESKKVRYTPIANLDIKDKTTDQLKIKSTVKGLLKNADTIMDNVCKGMYP